MMNVTVSEKELYSATHKGEVLESTQDLVSKPKRLHLDHIDGLRGMAALYVAYEHFLPRAWGDSSPSTGFLRLLAKVLVQGHFAVTMFIVISGFCLMIPVVRSDNTIQGGSASFFLRRFWRIAPPCYIAFLLSALLLQAGHGSVTVPAYYNDTHITAVQVIGHLLLMHSFIPGAFLPNNGALWSISIESAIYLTFPLFVLLWRRLSPVKATLIFLTVSCLLTILSRYVNIVFGTPQYIGAFALGALAAGISLEPTKRWFFTFEKVNWYGLAILIFILLSVFCLVVGWEKSMSPVIMPWLDASVAASTACLLIGLSKLNSSMIKSVLCWRPLVFIGTFSYSLYMVHYPIEDIVFNYIIKPLHVSQSVQFLLMATIALPIIVMLAYAFFLAFEKPFHGIAKRIGTKSKK
jgi:peptidoglycan/LPS O-acetylase OafA/YrhL